MLLLLKIIKIIKITKSMNLNFILKEEFNDYRKNYLGKNKQQKYKVNFDL